MRRPELLPYPLMGEGQGDQNTMLLFDGFQNVTGYRLGNSGKLAC
jgi:hypothetical protein